MSEVNEKLDKAIALLMEIRDALRSHPQSTTDSQVLQSTEAFSNSDAILAMIKSSEWPEAVPGDLICTESEADKQERAEGIIEMMLPQNITKFLDYGCGEGHVPEKIAQRVNTAVGYDITQQGDKTWEEPQGNLLLTTNLDKVKQQGPYDTILIYDVIDHVKPPMIDVLAGAKSVLAPGGKIYVRAHPWTGRHGGHLYRKLNKAFAHFILTDDELRTLGIDQEKEIERLLHPIGVYRYFFKANNLNIEHENIPKVIDNYFENNVIQQRIKEIYRDTIAKGYSPEWGWDFCDFILTT